MRRTKLASLAAERAEGLRALTLPEGSLLQASGVGRRAQARRTPPELPHPHRALERRQGRGRLEVAVRLRLPKGKTARQVRVYSTDSPAEPKAVAFKQKGDAVEFTLPSVRVYAVCEVTF